MLRLDAREKTGLHRRGEDGGAPLSVWMRERLRIAAAHEFGVGRA